MTNRSLTPLCAVCGEPVEAVDGTRAVRCPPCFDGYLRSIDAGFLEHFAEFGARSHRLLAETCLRALVLAAPSDRQLLGLNIYEQFTGAATDLIAIVTALRERTSAPIARTFMDFTLDEAGARRFFHGVAALTGGEWLAALGLPLPGQVPPGLPRRIQRDVVKSLHEALADVRRLNDYRDLGERALALAAGHLGAGALPAGRTAWLAGRELTGAQVASVALDRRRGRLDVAALRVDEQRMEQVVDAIDVVTRLARNLAYAFVTLHDTPDFLIGFAGRPRVHAG